MKNWIIKSNEWYDNLPEPKRFIVFMLIVMLPIATTQYLMHKHNQFWTFPIFVILFVLWRGYYFLYKNK